MEKSILGTTKKNLGLDPGDTSFDVDVITHINSTFSTLTQMGVGPPVFQIEDGETEWETYLLDDTLLNLVKTYVYRKVRMAFDPPTSSYTQTAFKEMIAEDEFRIVQYCENLQGAPSE